MLTLSWNTFVNVTVQRAPHRYSLWTPLYSAVVFALHLCICCGGKHERVCILCCSGLTIYNCFPFYSVPVMGYFSLTF